MILALFSCSGKKIRNICIKGVVIDKITKVTVDRARVTVLFWNQVENYSEELNYVKKECVTDKNGAFTAIYKGGIIAIDLAVKASNYKVSLLKIKEIPNDTLNIIVELNKANLSSKTIFYQKSDSLFISIREYKLPKEQKIEDWGINIEKGTSVKNLQNVTVWAESKKGVPVILVTSHESGIIPIFRDNIKQSILYEYDKAPTSGYVSRYQLKGNEAGFFVHSKGKYAKLIRVGKSYQKTVPYKEGYYVENGINFKLIYQPDGTQDLNIEPINNLENFILEGL
jgi:hypothetical protein